MIAPILILLLLLCSDLFPQDPGFSQFYSNHLYLNPAFAGNPRYKRISMVYRNQWLTRESPYVTYGVSYDMFLHRRESGIGFNLVNDVQGQGAINRLSADAIFSHSIQVAYNAQIRGGIQAGGILLSNNPNALVFPDMISPEGEVVGSTGYAISTRVMPDFAVGFVGEWDNLFGGFSVHHLAQPVELHGAQRVTLPRKYTVHAGYNFSPYRRYIFRNFLTLSPNIIYMQQQNFRRLSLGVYLNRESITAGIWLKQNLTFASHTFVFMAGYSDAKYRFGYSYDFSILKGGLRGINTSTHEVTFGVNLEYKSRVRKKFRYIKCPKI